MRQPFQMAQHHVHWNADLKWLALGICVLWLIARPKSPPAKRPTLPVDEYTDANGVTWSREMPVGSTSWLGQALTGAYAGKQLGPFRTPQELQIAIDKFAAANK